MSDRSRAVGSPSRRWALPGVMAGIVTLGLLCVGCATQDPHDETPRSATEAPLPAPDVERERLERLAAESPAFGFASGVVESASAFVSAFETRASDVDQIYQKLQLQNQYLMKVQSALHAYLDAPDDPMKRVAGGLNGIAETNIKANNTILSIMRGDSALPDQAAVAQLLGHVDGMKRESLARLDVLMVNAVDVLSGLNLSPDQRRLLASDIDRLFGEDLEGDPDRHSAIVRAVGHVKENLGRPRRQ